MIENVFIRTEFNYDRDDASDECAIKCVDPSLTHQSFKDECDINVIVERFGLLGELPQGVRQPSYGDFTGINNYADALAAIRAADESFMAMPAQVRARFGNDPEQFVAFCSDEANKEEAKKLGLVEVKEPAVLVPDVKPAA